MSILIFENLEKNFLTFILTQQIVYIYEHCQSVIFLNYLYSRLQNFQNFQKKNEKFFSRGYFFKTRLLKMEHYGLSDFLKMFIFAKNG